jgi:hypothetical protein
MLPIILAAVLSAPCNAHPVYVLEAVVSAPRAQRDGRVYRASANFGFHVVEKTPAMISSVDPGLLDHVRGRQIIAQRVARSSVGSVRAAGSSADQARARLQQAIVRLTSDAQKELDREEHVYESVTENGAAQSQGPVYGFPGGPDAHDSCAQP